MSDVDWKCASLQCLSLRKKCLEFNNFFSERDWKKSPSGNQNYSRNITLDKVRRTGGFLFSVLKCEKDALSLSIVKDKVQRLSILVNEMDFFFISEYPSILSRLILLDFLNSRLQKFHLYDFLTCYFVLYDWQEPFYFLLQTNPL